MQAIVHLFDGSRVTIYKANRQSSYVDMDHYYIDGDPFTVVPMRNVMYVEFVKEWDDPQPVPPTTWVPAPTSQGAGDPMPVITPYSVTIGGTDESA
jgi:hypothetical protein